MNTFIGRLDAGARAVRNLRGSGLPGTSRDPDRAVGGRWRHRCNRAHHRRVARKGNGPAGQRRQPHRRQRSRRARRDRVVSPGRLHHRHGDRRDRHDALADSPTFPARRTRRSGWSTRIPRIEVASDAPYKSVNELVAAIKASPGKFKASGTGQGGIWHLAIAGMLQDMKIDPATVPWVPSNGAAPGLQDLVAGGVPMRTGLTPRGALADRCRQGEESRGDGRAAFDAVSKRADAQGRDGKQLDDGCVARHCRTQGHPRGRARQAGGGDPQDRSEQGLHRVHGAARLRGHFTRDPRTSPSSWPNPTPISAQP